MNQSSRNTPKGSRLKRYLKLQSGWTIMSRDFGIYYDSFSQTRRGAINGHCSALGKTWEYCQKKGDIVIRTALFSER